MCTSYCVDGHMPSVLLGVYLGVELLGHAVTLNLWKIAKVFHSGYTVSYPHQQCMRTILCPHPHQCSLSSVCFFGYSHASVNRTPTVGTCISLMAKDVYWPFEYLLWRNVYSILRSFLSWVICLSIVEL